MKPIALNYPRCEIFVWDHDARRVSVFIKDGLDMQSLDDDDDDDDDRGGGGAANQIEHHFPSDQ